MHRAANRTSTTLLAGQSGLSFQLPAATGDGLPCNRVGFREVGFKKSGLTTWIAIQCSPSGDSGLR